MFSIDKSQITLNEKLKIIDDLQEFLLKNSILNTLNQNLDDDFKLEYTYNSNAIEGNTLTLAETKVVLEGLTIGGKTLREHFEIINHAEAIDFIEDLVKNKEPLSQNVICDIHRLILKNINNNEAGKYRKTLVSVGGFIPPQPYLLNSQMEEFINNYKNLNTHPILKASFAHLEFVRIHPFIVGNGRTARLIMNLELLKNEFLAINILFEKRSEYYQAIREYSSFHKGTSAFDNLIADYVIARLKEKKEWYEKSLDDSSKHTTHKRR